MVGPLMKIFCSTLYALFEALEVPVLKGEVQKRVRARYRWNIYN